jgi:peptidoglycan/LPS O-acetylase OafA/YrhL
VTAAHRYPALDGLRGIAAVIVLLFHLRWWLPNGKHLIEHGYLAVDFFFVLSGFVVAHTYQARLRDDLGFAAFLKIRAIRLYPLIVAGAVLGLIAANYPPLGPNWLLVTLKALPFAAGALPMPPGIMAGPFELNGPSWTIFFEIVVSISFAACIRVLNDRVLVTLLVASGAFYGWVSYTANGLLVGWEYHTLLPGFGRAVFPFYLGVALFRLKARYKPHGLSLPLPVLGLLLVATYLPSRHSPLNFAYDTAVVVLVYPCVILAAAGGRRSIGFRFENWGGFISYPLYILQKPLISLLEHHVPHRASSRMLFAFAAAILIVTVCHCFGLADLKTRRALTLRLRRPAPLNGAAP